MVLRRMSGGTQKPRSVPAGHALATRGAALSCASAGGIALIVVSASSALRNAWDNAAPMKVATRLPFLVLVGALSACGGNAAAPSAQAPSTPPASAAQASDPAKPAAPASAAVPAASPSGSAAPASGSTKLIIGGAPIV